jgi:hypothetical protein
MKKTHLDFEYRNRWIEFHLADGTIEDSRLKNWRDVVWSQVVCLIVCMLGYTHNVSCDGPNFKAFMNFRWGGLEAVFDENGEYVEHKAIKIWTVGWTDGESCFLKDIDFHTGMLIKNYKTSLVQFKGHLHPDVRDKVLGV